MLKRITIFAYGIACYVLFLVTFLYAAGFVGNLFVPKSIDSAPIMPFGQALLIDTMLLGIFAVQHSVMARRGFKQWWTRIIPEEAERSTYVFCASLALLLLFWKWQPLGGVIWQMNAPAAVIAMHTIFVAGIAIVLTSTFLINHFDLFGLRQVTLQLTGKPYTHAEFRTPFFYRYVRHPLYFGFLLFFWATPVMTGTHLFFALMVTGYILIAIQFEERDLVRVHGDLYLRYREQVPMILPYPAATTVETSSVTTAGQPAR